MAIRRKQFNNFFKIQNGKAVDLGNTRPTGIKRDAKLRGRFAIVKEKSGRNTASTFKAASSSQAFDKIRRSAKRARTNTRVILGRPVGKKNGVTIFRDVAGYTKVRD